MNWTQPIDAYCERTGPAFWSEPVNAVTNIAFILAAIAALRLWIRGERRDWPAFALIVVIAVIGTGSFLFHTLANGWTLLADVLPITAFIYVYFYLAMRRFLGLTAQGAVGATLVFFAASYGFGAALPEGFLNGSGSYLPALFAIVVVGLVLAREAHPAARGILVTGSVFAVSVTARSMDQSVCDTFPLGTHFLWHALNGLVLYILIATFLRVRPAVASVSTIGSPA